MRCIPQNAAQRRYLYRFLPAMVLYALCLIAAQYAFRYLHPTGATVYLIAALPAVPLLAVIAIVGLYLTEEPDEFERTVMVQSMLWAIGGTLGFTTIWGFLEIFAGITHFSPFLDFPLFWFIVGVVTPIIRWRYR